MNEIHFVGRVWPVEEAKMSFSWRVLIGCVLLGVPLSTYADSPEKGDNEMSLRASYTDVDFGSSSGVNFGGTTNAEVVFEYGWYLTDSHEVGVSLAYIKQELDGGDIVSDTETDGTSFGGFYHFNFKPSGNVTPFLGLYALTLGGDIGDVYDLEYGAQGGFKVYPFEHGGVGFSVLYSKLKSDLDGLPDADGLGLGVALLLKF